MRAADPARWSGFHFFAPPPVAKIEQDAEREVASYAESVAHAP
jgi:hypothetical protein